MCGMTTQHTSTPVIPEWTLGDRLRKALRVADIDALDMASCLGVSRNTIGNYLADRTTPSRGTLIAWALRCGVPFEWVADGTVTTHPGPNGASEQGVALTRWNIAA